MQLMCVASNNLTCERNHLAHSSSHTQACIPESIISRLESSSNPIDEGISIAAEQVKSFMGIAQGVHLMAVKAEQQIPIILDRANIN